MTGIFEAITQFFTANVNGTLAFVMLAALVMVGGAWLLYRRTGEATKPVLMVVLAIVAVINVAIWTVPTSDGTSPLEQLENSTAQD